MSNLEQTTNEELPFEEPTPGQRLMRWVWALGLLSLLAGGGYLLLLWEPHQLPIRVVTVEGTVKRLSPQHLQETVIAHLGGGILTQDLAELKTAVEAMPWVRSASLRRHWPDRLELVVVEQVALARWGEDALVCADGVVFKPEDEALPPGLPKLSGRDEDALALVEQLLAWRPKLQKLALEVDELVMDARGAWTLRLGAGFTLALGKTNVQERLSRFLGAYPELAAAGVPSLVDMRYSNGLAIRWAEPEGDGPRPEAGDASRSAEMKSGPSGPSRS